MKKILILFSFCAILSSVGCNAGSSMSPNGSGQSSGLIGTWTWINSEGGFRGGVVTPKDAGYTQQYTLRSDSTFSFLRTPDSASVSWSGDYSTTRQFYNITNDTQSFIMFVTSKATDPPVQLIRLQFHGTDTILLGDDATDGILETYARVK